jgi:hypothetical protein
MFANQRVSSIIVQRQLVRRLDLPLLALSKRCFSFGFVGPRSLEEILKKDMIKDKTPTEVADIWYTYHEQKVKKEYVHI